MAKKVVATLKVTTGKEFAKIIRMERSPKTGAYQFNENFIATDHIKDFLAKK